MFPKRKFSLRNLDLPLFIGTLFLCIYGLITLYSATYSYGPINYLRSQIIATVFGFIVLFILLLLDIETLKKLHKPIYLVINFFLVAVLFFGSGQETWGAKSWLPIGPFGFQPAEVAKIGLLICVAAFIERHKNNLSHPKTVFKLLLYAGLPIFFILRQPDLGTTIVFVFFISVMLFAAGFDLRYFLATLIAIIAATPFIYANMSEFRKNRIRNFLDPMRDIGDTGYQANQGKIAIGSGQMTGRGYLQGVQTQYNFIPTKETDYIFAVVGEELGFFGGFSLIALYALIIYRMIQISISSRDLFGRTLSIGVAAMMIFHIFENIGMTLGLMPITGIPLPFFSYGGTFQLTNLICIGLVLSIGLQKQPLDFSR